jgi:signal transduction histidine kinase/HAMP domain-containing protein
LVIAQPTLVYLSTNRVISEQAEVTENLVQAEVRTSRLLRQMNAIAAQARNIQFLNDADQLTQLSTSLTDEIDTLISEFSQSLGENEQTAGFLEMVDQVESYKSLIREVADAHILQLDYRTQLRENIIAINQTVSDKLSLLGPVIAERQIELDGHINALEFEGSQASTAALRQTFSTLITLNNIADTVSAEQYFLSTIERAEDVQPPQNLQSRLRSLTHSLAVQIAKLPAGETKSALARYTIVVTNDLFGPEGIFGQIDIYSDAKAQGSAALEKQQTLTSRLLEISQSLTNDAQEAFVATNQQANALIARARLYASLMAVLVGLLIIGLILFVVERQFNARIRKLTDRVLAIASGRPDPGTPDDANDELSAMGDALEVFKGNAAELRDANETLTQRNAQVQQLGARLETVLDTASSGIIAFDAEGQIILANLPARHFLGGISAQTPFSRPAEITFLDREDLSQLDASSDPLNRVIAGKILQNEIALMNRPGREQGRYVRLTSNRVDDAESTVRMVLAIDDVSEAEQNRQQIERTARLDALGQLTGGIAHDFNNLLATIQYAIKLSSGGADPERREKYQKIALDSVERGAQLSSRLLTFAKRQPGMSRSHKIEDILSDFEELIAPTIESAITISLKVETPGMNVYCDRAQLENALLNLVLNARDAILSENKGDEITVAVRSVSELKLSDRGRSADPNRYPTNALEAELRAQEDGSLDHSYRYIEFLVTDNGPGMTNEVKHRALDPFFTTKSTNSGTGLGLSMVYGFVQQSGGEMRVYSELGHGTTMQLLLPRGSDDNEREEPVLRDIPVAGNGQRILVVEDEVYLREAMNDLIVGLGYEVQVASSGREAMKLIEDGLELDLLLTDIVMPGGIGGFDLAAGARKVHPQLPILYMSGYAAYTDREMGVVIAPLLQKPCSPLILAERLNEALG